jgi:DNA-binding NarL/FixJ family response regulator
MKQIAHDLGIGKDTVGKYAQIVYRQHHVRTRVELMRVLGSTHEARTRAPGAAVFATDEHR